MKLEKVKIAKLVNLRPHLKSTFIKPSLNVYSNNITIIKIDINKI